MARKRTLENRFARAAKRLGLSAIFMLAAGGGLAVHQAAKASPTRPPDAVAAEVMAPTQPTPDIKPVFDITKLPYDQQVFQYNVLPGTNDNLPAMTPEQRGQFYFKQFCFSAGKTPGEDKQQKELSEALSTLATLSYIGKPMVNLVSQGDVKFCGLTHLPSGIAAQYLPTRDAVISSPFSSKEDGVLKVAHEITHAAQDKNKLLNYETNWDIQSRVTRNLSVEAAALVSEFLVPFEAKVAGDPTYWTYLQTHFGGTTYNDKETYRLIETSYQAAIDAGKPKEEAIREAGRAAFRQVFESDDWRNFYLNSELMIYLGDINAGAFKDNHTVAHMQFGQDKIDLAGKIGAEESFTRGAQFPDVNGLIARDQKMKWAYEAAEIARMKQMEGPNGKTAATMTTDALLNFNPYLALDLGEVYKKATDESWQKDKKFRYVYEVMDEMLKQAAPVPVRAPVASAPRAPMM